MMEKTGGGERSGADNKKCNFNYVYIFNRKKRTQKKYQWQLFYTAKPRTKVEV